MSEELANQETGQVPDLVRPALDIGVEDIVLPRIKIGQYSTKQVKNRGLDVTAGDIFSASSEDEGDVLWEAKPGDDNKPTAKGGVLIHVLTLRKGKSWTDPETKELQTYSFDDPAAPADAWTTYNYLVAVPEVDDEVPFKWLFTKTGRPAAQQINTVLSKNASRGPAWNSAFRLSTAFRGNPKGDYYVPRVHVEDAKPKNIEIAENLATIALRVPDRALRESQTRTGEKVDI